MYFCVSVISNISIERILPVFTIIMNDFVTVRKRSLGQGNVFAPVCHSVHKGGTWAGTPPAGTPHLGQVHTPLAGTPLGRYPPGRYPLSILPMVNARAVRILLECILVFVNKSGLVMFVRKEELDCRTHQR